MSELGALSGPALLVTSALLHASWNAMLKRERAPEAAVTWVLLVALLVATGAALRFPGAGLPTGRVAGWAVGAGLCEGLYFVALAAALARAPYGAVYAVARGGALLLVWPAAALLLHEPVTASSAAGAALVCTGVFLVAWAGHAEGGGAGLALAALCAAGIAGYHLCYDRALAGGGAPAPIFAIALGVAWPLAWLATRLRGGTAPLTPRSAARWTLAGVVCAGSFLLFLAGLAATGAGAALTLRNTSVVFAQAIALLMGERPPRRQLAGAALVVLGASLVAWR